MKTGSIQKMIQTALSIAVIGVVMALPAAATDRPVSGERLQTMAREARTEGEHAEVARHYRLRADALDVEAEQHEKFASELNRSAGAMAYKWPALVRGHQREKVKALQTRRSAVESRRLADQHIRMAVETRATSAN